MPKLSEEESNVARHYDESVFADELARLPQECPVEMAVTQRWLGRVAKPGDLVAEIGVGGGYYTEFLAWKSCRLHLVDVSARLLEAASQKLRKADLADSLAGCHHASGTRLEGFQSESFDLVLLMGPLYHLRSLEERQRSVQESARIPKKGRDTIRGGYQSPFLPARPAEIQVRTSVRACGIPSTVFARWQSGP
ncbi:MAG TPA: class I SAM-dependent methyltransferase [Candidatus Limnocylindrales bacterium]|nr:class I SAM-dependent methyltransferase [Candidatus Limnocylindrales bacterium]